ncbi:uncharacterized protein LOC134211422 isoform X1 [Armigeres subalbatus]|uniref:uncharacterized protein LOC134211422 isoform X1 n=1 Tax=Armigeres subalbatus TaxID=124917 RepID=UPI002ED213B2
MGLLKNRMDATDSSLFVIVAALMIAFWHPSALVSGDYPHDVELFDPVTVTTMKPKTTTFVPKRNSGGTVKTIRRLPRHYPSYVKGEDPVEEYNRRRLHVDTSDYMNGAQTTLSETEKYFLLDESLDSLRRKFAKRRNTNGEKKKNKFKTNKKSKKRRKMKKDPIKRTWSDDYLASVFNKSDVDTMAPLDNPKRYEESDPAVFPYEQTSEENGKQATVPMDTKYFQDTYCEQKSPLELEFGHLFETQDRWEERYERQDHKNNRHQGKVKWADKNGGFGEHYWDLNHV